MQIVIDIPESDYNRIIASNEVEYYELKIAQGIVLPKGHGDLIDKDQFEQLLRDYGLDYEADTFIPMATTVIEADK